MGKIIYNTDNELSFRLQGTVGEVPSIDLKGYGFNLSSGGNPDVTVGYMDFSYKFTMDISEDDYMDFLAFTSWVGRGQNYAIQFNPNEIVNTTLNGVAGKQQTNKKLVPLASTTGLDAQQKCFMRSDDDLKFEGVEIASVTPGVSITTVDDLKFDYISGDIFRSYRFVPVCILLKMEKFDPARTGALDDTAQGYRRFSMSCMEDLT